MKLFTLLFVVVCYAQDYTYNETAIIHSDNPQDKFVIYIVMSVLIIMSIMTMITVCVCVRNKYSDVVAYELVPIMTANKYSRYQLSFTVSYTDSDEIII